MTEHRSSSNRAAAECDAVVVQQQRKVGPLRLPEHRADDFIEHFNRIYEGLGMVVEETSEQLTVDSEQQEKVLRTLSGPESPTLPEGE